MVYNELASQEALDRTVAGLRERNVEAIVVENKSEALEKIKKIIPAGAGVMMGASVTLEEIGLVDYLKEGKHPWQNLRGKILEEKDPAKQAQMRREATLADYYLGSVHGLSEEGEFVIASNTGSQLPGIVFNSPNLIFVVGAQKIVPTLEEARKRLKEYVVPLEDKHMHDLYNIGTHLSKEVIFHYENPIGNRHVRLIIVKEKLGF
ncbi:MAG TPA: lactate utilization protein [Candidatus Paceibacterota bacterium]|nr:lactate utilization protein [Candidatus Paceibacterota bacterium]